MKNEKIFDVAMLYPGEEAKLIYDVTFDEIRKMIGCDIVDTVRVDPYVIIVDDEGMINSSAPNRVLTDEDGDPIQILYGTIAVLRDGYEDFESLKFNDFITVNKMLPVNTDKDFAEVTKYFNSAEYKDRMRRIEDAQRDYFRNIFGADINIINI